MCAMDILAAEQLRLQASVNASDFDRYFRAPVDAADRRIKKKKNAAQLHSVARGWSSLQSCCF